MRTKSTISAAAGGAVDALPKLKKFERGYRLHAVMLFVIGVVVMLIAPLLIAGVIKFRETTDPKREQHSFTHHFVIVALVAIPIMLVLAKVISGNLSDRTVEALPGTYHPVETEVGGRAVAGLAIFDVLLWGPQMVMMGIGRLWSLRAHAKAERALAAKIVGVLLARNDGILIHELIELVHAPAETFGDALAYLTYMDIIGISKGGDRVWMQSLAREWFNRS